MKRTKTNPSLPGVRYLGDLKKNGFPGKSGISEHVDHVMSVFTINRAILNVVPNSDVSTQTSDAYNFCGADILIYYLAEHKGPFETFLHGLEALSTDGAALKRLITTNVAIVPVGDEDGSRISKHIFHLLGSSRKEKYILVSLYSGLIVTEIPARHLWKEPDCVCPLSAFIGSDTNPNEIRPWDGTAEIPERSA